MFTFVRGRFVSTLKPRWRSYGTSNPRSPHAQWYADIVPAMIPIFLLGSAVYLGLQLAQQKLSHEKYIEEASQHVKTLEAEVEALQAEYMRRREGEASVQTPGNKTWRWWR
ncbi:hypothetical protein L208DRAFT_1412901 [Tricholoma matsutake]|nr:hypothetical protein L208DRAFT_1412901 [Tricholoma matsutake 945]